MLISSETVDSVKKFGKTALKTKKYEKCSAGFIQSEFQFYSSLYFVHLV